MKNLIYKIALFFLISSLIEPELLLGSISINYCGMRTMVNPFEINSMDYVDCNNLDFIFKTHYKLKFLPGSFFYSISRNSNTRILQMNLPAIDIYGKIFVPLNSFFTSIKNEEILSVSMSSRIINLSSIRKYQLENENSKNSVFKNMVLKKEKQNNKFNKLYQIPVETNINNIDLLNSTINEKSSKQDYKKDNVSSRSKIKPSRSKTDIVQMDKKAKSKSPASSHLKSKNSKNSQ